MKHYYLAASLPALALGEAPPLSSEEFRFDCTGVLTPEELQELDLLLADRAAEGVSEFAQRWAGMDTQLRNAVARQRAARRGLEPHTFLRPHPGFSAELEKAVAGAFAGGHPLERELALDRLRWQALEDLAQADQFGTGAILAFAFKLRLVERWARLQEPAGRGRLEELLGRLTTANGSAEGTEA